MKRAYVAALVFILAVGVAVVVLLISSPIGEDSRTANAIQAAAVSVALAAAVIAIGAADPSPKEAKASIEVYIPDKDSITHGKANLSRELTMAFEHLPDPFMSYRVYFRIENESGFTLAAPALTFRLPLERRHLHSIASTQIATFNSNLFNSREDMRELQFANTQILSNSNLPYWNDGEQIEIWIRMTLEPKDFKSFDVGISLNAENASGFSTNVKISASSRQP
ncbi:MAG: hypothetical protein IIA89_02780 [Chloroflexi bacterium]|nr:hypothetical protein [Chloroflexota bacterium]